jgi:hypothetical protein
VHAVDLLQQVRQARLDHRTGHGDHELVGGVRAVPAEDADFADVDAEAAEHRRHPAERSGLVGEAYQEATLAHEHAGQTGQSPFPGRYGGV